MGSNHNDPHLCHYLEEEFLKEQVESIYELAKHHANLLRLGDGIGVFLYDKELRSKNEIPKWEQVNYLVIRKYQSKWFMLIKE